MSMTKFNVFEFKYGKEKKSLKEWIKIGVIFHGSLDLVSLIPGIEKKKLFNFIDELQLRMGTIDIINDYVIQDSELILYRIDRVINQSISEYEKNNV